MTESQAKFDGLSVAAGNSYSYSRRFDTSFGASWYRTTIRVINGDVVERVVEDHYHADGNVITETSASQNLGDSSFGHPVKTMPELYDECRNEVLTQDPEKNEITLGFFDSGVLQYCFYRQKGCVDDCTVGVTIEMLNFDTND
ncbi:MAG TPA: hypothetical protein PKD61_14270 [Polyangiaceae bacterium]|nr:hypothetical protein [Polyangiaceae bacterium]